MELAKVNAEFLEETVLGCILKDPCQYEVVCEHIDAQDFNVQLNRKIFEAMTLLRNDDRPIDTFTVEEVLRLKGHTGDIFTLCVDMQRSVPHANHASDYANSLKNVTHGREFDGYMENWRTMADKGEPVGKVLAMIDNDVQKLSGATVDEGVMIGEGLQIFFDDYEDILEGGGPLRVDTGFKDLDFILQGMRPGNLVVIGGRPSMGKTTFVLNVVRNIMLAQDFPILFFSLEMSQDQIIQSLLACTAGVPLQHLRECPIPQATLDKALTATQTLCNSKLKIISKINPTLANIKAQARKFKRKYPDCGLIVIDYLSFIKSPGAENNVLEIGAITRDLKLLAGELELPLILLSQLSRDCEKGVARQPQLSDFRGSGSIEQDADIAMFVYRDKAANDNAAKIIVGKNRFGKCAEISLIFDGSTARFKSVGYNNQE